MRIFLMTNCDIHFISLQQSMVDYGCDWSQDAQNYSDLHHLESFISELKHEDKKEAEILPPTTEEYSALQGKQIDVYDRIRLHSQQDEGQPLNMIVHGTAGTGKSFLIDKLRKLLGQKLAISAPTGVAAYNISGQTIHSLFRIMPKADFQALKGDLLNTLQENFRSIKYIIIDEMSMIGRRMFGKIDQRLRQAFPNGSGKIFGGCLVILFGDFGQLPPVLDLPIYSVDSRENVWSSGGQLAYQSFNEVVRLEQVNENYFFPHILNFIYFNKYIG